MSRKRLASRNRTKSRWRSLPFACLALLAGVLAFGLYVNTLGHQFVFDDTTLIVQNPQVTGLQWSEIFGRQGYRPLRTLTYALNYALGGLDPFGYHLFNVLLHSLNTLLVGFLILKVASSRLAALAGALIFASHPVQTAAVAYVSGRKDLLATFFVVLACILYLSFRERKRSGSLLGAIAAFLLGVLSKEVAIVLPLLLVVLDIGRNRRQAEALRREEAGLSVVESIRRIPAAYLVFALLALFAFYYSVFVAQASRMEGLWGGSLSSHIGTSFKLFLHYLRLAVFPYPLVADYTGNVFSVSSGLSDSVTLLAVVVFIAFVAATLWCLSKVPFAGIGMAWFLITLLPVLQIIPFHEIAADHFLYLPVVGVSLAAGWVFRMAIRGLDIDILGWSALGLVLLVFSLVTIDRNRDWKDARTLWEATYSAAPGSYRANTNLGIIYYTLGDWRKAIETTRRAVRLKPEGPLPHANLGAILRERGYRAYVEGDLLKAKQLEWKAIEHLQEATRLDPGNPFTVSNLGDCFRDLALIADQEHDDKQAAAYRREAKNQFRWAMKIGSENPEFPLVWFKYGSVLVDEGNCRDALTFLKDSADRLAHRHQVQFQAGYCSFVEKNYEDGIHYLERTLQVWPASEGATSQLEETFLYLGESYEARDQLAAAARTYARLLKLFPNSLQGHYRAGVVQYKVGGFAEAVRRFRRALALNSKPELASEIQRWLERAEQGLRPN